MWQSEGDHVSTETATWNFCLLSVRLSSEKNKHPTRLFTLLFTWFSFSLIHIYIYDSWQAQIKFLLFLSPVSGPYRMEIVKRGRKWSAITHSSLILRQTRYRPNLKPQESFAACLTASESDSFAVTTFFPTSSKEGICSAAMSSSAVAAFGFLLLLLPLQGIVHLLCPCLSQSFGLVPVPPVEI